MGCFPSRVSEPVAPAKSKDMTEFKSRVFRKRKLSDSTLERVLQDPYVSSAFMDFLRGQFGEKKLQFWLEVESFLKAPQDQLDVLKVKASLIYTKFIADSICASEIGIDAATRVQIESDLMIRGDGSYEVEQHDTRVLGKAFNLLANKKFQELKFEYLGPFVVSDNFKSLRGDDGYFKNIDDAAAKASELLNGMDAGYVLTHPLGLHFFCKFVYESDLSQANDYLDLFTELSDILDGNADYEHRLKRFHRICKRYTRNTGLEELESLIARYDSSPEDEYFKGLPPHLFQPIYLKLVNCLSVYMDDFKGSQHFKRLMSSMTTESVRGDPAVVYTNEQRKSTTKGTIQAVHGFVQKRNLSTSTSYDQMDSVINTSLGLCHLKKFAIECFMEEHVLFWIEVNNYKEGNFLTPSHGTVMSYNPGESTAQIRKRRAQRIFEKYVKPDSPIRVNISSDMQERIEKLLESEDTITHAFDEAHKETFELLRLNIWEKFQRDKRYQLVKKKLQEKDFKRQSQGRVGA